MKEETSIVQAFSKTILDQWLRFDLINNKYRLLQNKQKGAVVYLPRATEEVLLNNQQKRLEDRDFYVQQLDPQNNEETKKSVLEYYLLEEGEKLQRQFPQLTSQEVRAKAAINFKLLTKSQKLYFFRKFLKQNKYQNHNQQMDNNHRKNNLHSFNNRVDKIGVSNNNFYDPFGLSQSQVPSLFNNPPENHWKQQQQEKMLWQFPSKDQFLLFGNDRINQENMSGLKIPSASGIPLFDRQQSKKSQNNKASTSKQSEKSGQKGEQSKDKADYQTLKSLFKRLQSTV